MGNYLFSTDQTQNKKVKVWFLNQDKAYDFPLSITLQKLRSQFKKLTSQFVYFYFHWALLGKQVEDKTLQEIIDQQLKRNPHNSERSKVFIAMEEERQIIQKSAQAGRQEFLYQKLKDLQPFQENELANYTKGHNGQLVLEGRQNAILASSILHAVKQTNMNQEKFALMMKKVQYNPEKYVSFLHTLFEEVQLLQQPHKAQKLFENKQNNQQDKYPEIASLNHEKFKKIKEKLQASKQFSDFDPKFVYYIEQIYLKYMVKSLGKVHYIKPQTIPNYQIHPIKNNSKIAIIGDFGTGLKDSLELLNNLINKRKVDVIFHLGDVYYAGTPEQYQVSITIPLNKLRTQTNRQIRFYSIPGNHDYYSWGLPFLCFVKSINEKQFHKQRASYFCVRDESQKWQFIGIDTAFHDSNPISQIYPLGIGPHIRHDQLQWHMKNLCNFKGSTILMTHHQLFSIHQRINGSASKYRQFSCLNPMLYAQLFQFLPLVSAWFWGHQHSFMLFKENLFGIQKCRLLGNSSFHVMFQKEHPYKRNEGFPLIQLIQEDQAYYKKYLPVNPKSAAQSLDQEYFNLCYAFIDLQSRQKNNESLKVEYWCSPCYSNDETSKSEHKKVAKEANIFEEYILYEESIHPIEKIKELIMPVLNSQNKGVLRAEIGLNMKVIQNQQEFQLDLDFEGTQLQIEILNQKTQERDKYFSLDAEIKIRFKTQNQDKIYLLGISDGVLKLIPEQKQNQLGSQCYVAWHAIKVCHQDNIHLRNIKSLRHGMPLKITSINQKYSLSWQINLLGKAMISLNPTQCRKQKVQLKDLETQNTKQAQSPDFQPLILNSPKQFEVPQCYWTFSPYKI